jgi:hypothetical protein
MRENNKKKIDMDKASQKLTPPEKAHIEELLKNAMTEYASKQVKVIKDKQELAHKLSGIISEFLGPFILMGYDTKGEPFNIIHAHSQMDIDAITTAINKFILGISGQENL